MDRRGSRDAAARGTWLLALGLVLFAGICVGSRAGTRWLWATIEQQVETLAVLRLDIEEAGQTFMFSSKRGFI